MRIMIDHKLRIARSELPPDIEELIIDALTIPNAERIRAMEQGIPGWPSMPVSISLWRRDKINTLVMPRGFLRDLESGLNTMGVSYEKIDNTLFESMPPMANSQIALHIWQKIATTAMTMEKIGIWKAPPGSGKTVAVLELISRLRCPSIVLISNVDILYQWHDKAKFFLGSDFPVSLIGDGQFGISDYLTVATVQTINSRFGELERDGFFDDQFSLMCLDECHHATAETYRKIVDRFSSRYRFGVSATPDKTGNFALATNILGPIAHQTMMKDVTTLVKPTVFRVLTNFKFRYHGREGRIPSNYANLLSSLTTNVERNAIICATILLNKRRHNLVCSRQLDQLRIIGSVLEKTDSYEYPILYLTGDATREYRKHVIEMASGGPCVILSTLADEALDIPRLDGLHLVFPQRNSGAIQQQIGRVLRPALGKIDAAVFDYCDPVGPLESQWQARRAEVYLPNKYEVTTVLPDEVMRALGELGEYF